MSAVPATLSGKRKHSRGRFVAYDLRLFPIFQDADGTGKKGTRDKIKGRSTMTQICTCSHLRREHQGGKYNISRFKVHDCMVQGCKCTQYYPNRESRREQDNFIMPYVKNGIIAFLVGCSILTLFYFAMDGMINDLTITSKETGLEYYNTTISSVFSDISEPQGWSYGKMVVSSATTLAGVFVFGGVATYLAWQYSIYSKKFREMLFNEHETKSEFGQS